MCKQHAPEAGHRGRVFPPGCGVRPALSCRPKCCWLVALVPGLVLVDRRWQRAGMARERLAIPRSTTALPAGLSVAGSLLELSLSLQLGVWLRVCVLFLSAWSGRSAGRRRRGAIMSECQFGAWDLPTVLTFADGKPKPKREVLQACRHPDRANSPCALHRCLQTS